MIHRGERQLPGGGERLRGRQADKQRPHEPRTLGGGHQAHVCERYPRLAQRPLDDQVHELQMVAGGDLRDDPAELLVDLLR